MVQPDQKDVLDRPLTHWDLEETPQDGNRYEVIDGMLYVTPFPSYPHQEAVGQLFRALDAHVREQGLGKVFPAGLKVVLDEPSGVSPDIVYVSLARMDAMQLDGYYGAPDLVVEVLSSRPQVDRVIKAQKYARAGIARYWIVDPERRIVSAYRLDAGHYRLSDEQRGDSVFESELFPGLRIELSSLWV